MKVEDLTVPESVKAILIKNGVTALYPPQEEAIQARALEGQNLILASPTASGKTLIAELCALKHVLEHNGKVLYLSPLRALANEKFDEFKKYTSIKKSNGRRLTIGISTGDFDSSDPWLERYDVIVTTNEKADSLLRHRAKWMDEISLVVADEVHLLNDSERGPTLEVVLARLLQINPELQLLVLSATVKNADELADWLKAECVTTEWRPVTLKEGVALQNEILFKDGSATKVEQHSKDVTINLVTHIIKAGGQALIFASTRKNAVADAKRAAIEIDGLLSKPLKRSLTGLSEQIATTGEHTRIGDALAELIKNGTAFHHAGLSGSHRKIIEDAFRNGKIKVLTATPTLAFGVNLPARMVIIHDYRRYEMGYGYYPISVLEYKQMAGRAGRPKYDKVGEAVLIAKTDDERDYLMESYVLAQPERIWSKLAVERILRPHVLATIAADYAQTEQGVFEFFGKTFYAYQYSPEAIQKIIAKILKFLYDEDMIGVNGEKTVATEFGRRISELYIDPVSGVIIRDAMRQKPALLSDTSFLHMVAHTPDMFPKTRPYSSEFDQLAVFVDSHREEFFYRVPDELEDRIAFEEFLGEAKAAMVMSDWIDERTEDEITEHFSFQPGDLYRLVETGKWLLHASHELAVLLGSKEYLQPINALKARLEKGVKKELLPLVKLEGVGRVRARIMYNSGLKTIEDLRHSPVEELTKLPLIGPKLAKKIKEQVGGFVKTEEWEKLKAQKGPEQQPLTDYY
ncbi:MAG TPA: DEAD/DEAH box helicase [Candidatus Bathyarchaeia archaeon]|nr:DEAD/DEAH box helicase [Candidatus Bathyarchaeia archaeon]